MPNSNAFFGPTLVDWFAEIALATGPTYAGPNQDHPPVNSDYYSCVQIIDRCGHPLDAFVLMDRHDPYPGNPNDGNPALGD